MAEDSRVLGPADYRNYQNSHWNDRIHQTYNLMHTNQTVHFVKQKHGQWASCNHKELTLMEALCALDDLVDESDPDVDVPNSFHAYQTAEEIRKVHPEKDWLHLVGLIHDTGKILALWGEPQKRLSIALTAVSPMTIALKLFPIVPWSVVGDSYPVGCRFQNSIVYRDSTFTENPDEKDPYYNSLCGMYEPNCGLDKVLMSWGHDEYMYNVLRVNNCKIPEEGLYMIRFHSFYPWHTSGDYMHLCNSKDLQMLEWVQEFNKFDLYTKYQKLPNIKQLQPYYQSLIDKYCPGKLRW